MLINGNAQGEVKFISYTGKSPNLCRGILTLSIHEKEYAFGPHFKKGINEPLYPQFWRSGGSCGFTDNEIFNENVPFGCCGGCL